MGFVKKPGIKIPRPRRIKFMNPQDGCYHVVSRALQKEFRFHEQEKTQFLRLLKWLSKVYFVRVATFAVLDNHVHLVIKMIPQEKISLAELERRLNLYYEQGPPRGMEEAFEQGDTADYYAHFSDISMFMWDLKLRFARWYNKVHSGYGHVWAERFTSVLVVGSFALRACMIYVELNAVRAELVKRPEEYAFCGLAHLLKAGRHASWLDEQLLAQALQCKAFKCSNTKKELQNPVESYLKAVYAEGLNIDESKSPVSDGESSNTSESESGSLKINSVFTQRIPAMTCGAYIDDLGVCGDLFTKWWEDFQATAKPPKKVLTLPDGIPIDQLPTLLKRPTSFHPTL